MAQVKVNHGAELMERWADDDLQHHLQTAQRMLNEERHPARLKEWRRLEALMKQILAEKAEH